MTKQEIIKQIEATLDRRHKGLDRHKGKEKLFYNTVDMICAKGIANGTVRKIRKRKLK